MSKHRPKIKQKSKASTRPRPPREVEAHDTFTWRPSRRTSRIVIAVSTLLAAGAIAWYVADPGVVSYQARILLLPALGIVLFWLHRRLPNWLEWCIAIPAAAIGPVGYIVWGGDQWWSWGQLSSLPLIALLVGGSMRRAMNAKTTGGRQTSWDGGTGFDGPWGPP